MIGTYLPLTEKTPVGIEGFRRGNGKAISDDGELQDPPNPILPDKKRVQMLRKHYILYNGSLDTTVGPYIKKRARTDFGHYPLAM